MSHTSLGDLLRAKIAADTSHLAADTSLSALDFLAYKTGLMDAIGYCERRKDDATKLAAVLTWQPHPHLAGVVRTELYGLSILWDVFGGVLHAGNPPGYEFISRKALEYGQEDPEFVEDFRQLVAFILARYW